MRRIQKTDFKNVISEHHQNTVLDAFIYIKSDTECNETAPAISFDLFHEVVKVKL